MAVEDLNIASAIYGGVDELLFIRALHSPQNYEVPTLILQTLPFKTPQTLFVGNVMLVCVFFHVYVYHVSAFT
jgi:hypothetical protein